MREGYQFSFGLTECRKPRPLALDLHICVNITRRRSEYLAVGPEQASCCTEPWAAMSKKL